MNGTNITGITNITNVDNITTSSNFMDMNSTTNITINFNYTLNFSGVYDIPEYDYTVPIEYIVYEVMSFTLLAFGIVTNSICFFILAGLRIQIGRKTTTLILACLALADWTYLVSETVFSAHDWSGAFYQSDEGCQSIAFFTRLSMITSSWMVVVLTVERFVSICFPEKLHRVISIKTVLIAFAGIMAAAFAFSLGLAFMIEVGEQNKYSCYFQEEHGGTGVGVDMAYFAAYGPLPVVIVLVLNGYAAYFTKHNTQAQGDVVVPNKMAMSQRTVAFVTIVFVIGLVPRSITACSFYSMFFGIIPLTLENYIMVLKADMAARIFTILNHSINFVLYVGVNKPFRADVINWCKQTFLRLKRGGSDVIVMVRNIQTSEENIGIS